MQNSSESIKNKQIHIVSGQNRKTEFRAGIKDGLPICIGYFAVSFAFGIQAAKLSLTTFQATMLSALNLTSAGQLAGIEVIAAGGSYLEMAMVQFVINLRYLLMSTALSQKIDPSLPIPHRLGIAYGVTDEIFAVSVTRKGTLSPFYSYGVILVATVGWVGGTAIGAAAGAILPNVLLSALGIALYGMFIAVILPPARSDRHILFAVLASMLLSTIMEFAPHLKKLSSGARIIVITVLVASFCAWKWPVSEEEENA